MPLKNASRLALQSAARVRYKPRSIEERDAVVARLREFLRFNYVTAPEVARRNRRDGSICVFVAFRPSQAGKAGSHHRLLRLHADGTLGHHADRLRVPGGQELARHS